MPISSRIFPFFAVTLLLSGCFGAREARLPVSPPSTWQNAPHQGAQALQTAPLKNWWQNFNDPVLDQLVQWTLADNPDQKSAQARIMEARGARRTAFGGLFPQIGASAEAGRADSASANVGNSYDAAFDASYEIDLFGKNRSGHHAKDAQVHALEASAEDVALSLVAEVTRTYIEMRGFQKQVALTRENLALEEQTLALVKAREAAGESSRLDVERAQSALDTLRARVPDFERQAENAALRLTILTGRMPEDISKSIPKTSQIPQSDLRPALMAPAKLLMLRPDIRAAVWTLEAQTQLTDVEVAGIFPDLTLSGLFGVAKTAISVPASVWSVAGGAAVSLIDFGQISGKIDSAKAREAQAYETLRKTVYVAVVDVETALNDTAQIHTQLVSLRKAEDSAQKALEISRTLYKEGQISFLDVLEAQRTANDSRLASVSAQVAQMQALVRLYKSLSVGL